MGAGKRGEDIFLGTGAVQDHGAGGLFRPGGGAQGGLIGAASVDLHAVGDTGVGEGAGEFGKIQNAFLFLGEAAGVDQAHGFARAKFAGWDGRWQGDAEGKVVGAVTAFGGEQGLEFFQDAGTDAEMFV